MEEENGVEGEAGSRRFAGSTGCWATGECLVSVILAGLCVFLAVRPSEVE